MPTAGSPTAAGQEFPAIEFSVVDGKSVPSVDNEEHILNILKRLLRKEPCPVSCASGGRIGGESRPGEETTFLVCLPAAKDRTLGSVSAHNPEEELIA